MRLIQRASLLALTALLPACATIVEGSSQEVTVETTPPGASCSFDRKGQQLGTVSPTPGSLKLDKSKNDLSVTCSKPGYTTATTTQTPKFVGTTFGNLLLGGAVGAIVDASTGANYTYPNQVKLDLAPVPPAPGLVPPALPVLRGPTS